MSTLTPHFEVVGDPDGFHVVRDTGPRREILATSDEPEHARVIAAALRLWTRIDSMDTPGSGIAGIGAAILKSYGEDPETELPAELSDLFREGLRASLGVRQIDREWHPVDALDGVTADELQDEPEHRCNFDTAEEVNWCGPDGCRDEELQEPPACGSPTCTAERCQPRPARRPRLVAHLCGPGGVVHTASIVDGSSVVEFPGRGIVTTSLHLEVIE